MNSPRVFFAKRLFWPINWGLLVNFMSKVEFDETEIAWIMHELSKYWLFDGIRKVMRLLTERLPRDE